MIQYQSIWIQSLTISTEVLELSPIPVDLQSRLLHLLISVLYVDHCRMVVVRLVSFPYCEAAQVLLRTSGGQIACKTSRLLYRRLLRLRSCVDRESTLGEKERERETITRVLNYCMCMCIGRHSTVNMIQASDSRQAQVE